MMQMTRSHTNSTSTKSTALCDTSAWTYPVCPHSDHPICVPLDLNHPTDAQFSHEHSRFDNLLQSRDANPIEKIRAMLWY